MGPYIIFYAVLALLFVLSLTAGKRGSCHHACWMAPFMMIGRRARNVLHLPGVQLRADTPACVACRACTAACPMSLDVQTMVLGQQMENSECILCGTCVDVCPHSVIQYDFGKPRSTNPGQPEKP
jgi:ferredoxin